MDDVAEQLVGWGKVARVRTRGRTSGQPIEVAVGYVEEPDGSLLVAAGSEAADWARNLDAEPRCTVDIGGRAGEYRAEALAGPERQRAIRELILRYGTPAERLGAGPAFRLKPVSRPGPAPP
jgi:deazaflavin-dependent oxidoreductase (nitroreductase family)